MLYLYLDQKHTITEIEGIEFSRRIQCDQFLYIFEVAHVVFVCFDNFLVYLHKVFLHLADARRFESLSRRGGGAKLASRARRDILDMWKKSIGGTDQTAKFHGDLQLFHMDMHRSGKYTHDSELTRGAIMELPRRGHTHTTRTYRNACHADLFASSHGAPQRSCTSRGGLQDPPDKRRRRIHK